MSNPRGLIAIPARLGSTRLPNKLLLDQTGKPLLAHVIDRALEAVAASQGLFTGVVVATDDIQLANIADGCGARSAFTSPDHRCGTTRIAEAISKVDPDRELDFVVNVQGDEPELSPAAIRAAADCLLADPTAPMATLVTPMYAGTEAMKQNPAAVKAVVDASNRAVYFSRAPIPYDRNPTAADDALWHLHLGIYAYRRAFLEEFAAMPASSLEEREGLEQLRAIQAGVTIRVACVPFEWAGKGIDTLDDYEAFVRRAN